MAWAFVAAGAAVISGYMQYEAAQEQADAVEQQTQQMKEAEKARGRSSAVEAQKERIKQIREARIRRGAVVAGAGNAGLGAGTSGTIGAVSAIGSQMGQNIGTINQMQTFAEEASTATQLAADFGSKAASAQAEGAMWQQIGGVAGSVFKDRGGWTTIFGGNTHKKA